MFVVANKKWFLGLSKPSSCLCAFYRRISELQGGAIDPAFAGRPGIIFECVIKFLKQMSSEASTASQRAKEEMNVKGCLGGDGQVVKGILRTVIPYLEGY